jgi:hypothetical protein
VESITNHPILWLSPIQDWPIVVQLSVQLSADLVVSLVALAESEGVLQMNVFQLGRSVRPIDHGHPVVAPPVGEKTRVIPPEHVDVRSVNEVVGENGRVAAAVVRTDNADARWIVAIQNVDEGFRPTTGRHPANKHTIYL